uniref:Transposase Tc1-like domain-containing protein n=1 Tax=Sander lucioperca TaxID=283035 RepID=A0A8C9ZX39_SANLU
MPMVPAHLRERALGMVQRGMRIADVARAINCNVRTVSRLRQRYRETGRTADRPRTGTGLQQQTARVTPGVHNPSISAQTFRNSLRDAGLRACRPVVRQVLTRHHRQQRRLWAQTHLCWTRQDWQKVLFTDESWFCLTRGDGRTRAISMLYITGMTSSSLMWYPSCRLILT